MRWDFNLTEVRKLLERISTPSRTKEIIEKNGFYFKKNFGQNFLIDSNIIDKIVFSAGITSDDVVLEIGPGIGSLTQVLCENAKKVIAVEIDNNLIPILNDTLGDYSNLEIINSDILKLDIQELVNTRNDGKPIKVVANLPYYITTPIIMELLEKKVSIKSMTVMVQKEVAERMQASPSQKDYGALSLAVQYYSDAHIDIIVPPSCFMPRPNVASAVITLDIYDNQPVRAIDEDMLFEVIKCAFGQRRKTLLNCFINLGKFGLKKEEYVDIITSIGLDERVRGEALSLSQFAKITDLIYDKIKK